MKRFISTNRMLLAALLIALCGCVLPQRAHAEWRLGASGGFNYNWYSINTHYQTDYHYEGAFGWQAAIFGQYNFFDWLGLRAELEASERNHRWYRTHMYDGTDLITHNTYLQLPIMAQFSFGSPKVRGFVNVGFYTGYWLDSREKGTFFDSYSDKTFNINSAYAFRKQKDQRWDFGLAGGLGIEYRCADHWSVFVEGRCYYSFISTVKQYMYVKDYRYNTTLGMNVGFAYIF